MRENEFSLFWKQVHEGLNTVCVKPNIKHTLVKCHLYNLHHVIIAELRKLFVASVIKGVDLASFANYFGIE